MTRMGKSFNAFVGFTKDKKDNRHSPERTSTWKSRRAKIDELRSRVITGIGHEFS